MSRNQRVVVLGLAVVVLVVAVVVIGTGGSSNSTKNAGPTTVVVQDAKPVGGVKDVTFKKGGTVDLTVKSDTADEVHFHGYDVHKDVAKGGSVHFSFPASIEGKFIVELEDHKQTLANVDGRRHEAPAVRGGRSGRARPAGERRAAGGRLRPRARRQAGPADPALAVRVGRGGRARRLVRRARHAVAEAAAAAGRASARVCARARRPRGRCAGRSASRSSRSSSTPGFAGTPDRDGEPRADVRLRRSSGSGSRSRRCCSATCSAPSTRGARSRAAWRGLRPRAAGGEAPEPLAYPRVARRWPAALGILAFAWVELSTSTATTRARSRSWRSLYAAVQLVGMSVYGIEPWPRNADAFGVYFGLFARSSPLHWRDARAVVRRAAGRRRRRSTPRAGNRRAAVRDDRHDQLRRLLAGRVWTARASRPTCSSASSTSASAASRARDRLHGRPARHGAARRRASTGSACSACARSARAHTTVELSRRFVHSLVPIALAYVVAHYFSLLVYQGQAMAYLISDPLGDGSDLFGTADGDDRLQRDQRHRRLVRPGRGARARPRLRAGRSPTTARSRSTARRATRRARSTGCSRSWSASPASACGSCRRPRNDRLARGVLTAPSTVVDDRGLDLVRSADVPRAARRSRRGRARGSSRGASLHGHVGPERAVALAALDQRLRAARAPARWRRWSSSGAVAC